MANEIEAVYLFALVIVAKVQFIKSNITRHILSIIILMPTYGFGATSFVVKAIRFFRIFYLKLRMKKETMKMTNEEEYETVSSAPTFD